MIRKVNTAQLPTESVCREHIATIDFQDAFKVKLVDLNISIENIYINVFAQSPKWINNLLALRNRIVAVFGINVDKETPEVTIENLKVGSKTGIFFIYAIHKNEIIAGDNEKHLKFIVSVLKQNDEAFISTLVQYNNRFGRIYFSIVKPFHKMVVKKLLRDAVKNKRI